jgi:hypothetical protein
MSLPGERRKRRWPSLPARLNPPPAKLRPLIGVVWYACLALALFSQAGQTWKVYEHYFSTVPPFASVGLILVHKGGPDWTVRPAAVVVRTPSGNGGPPVQERRAEVRLKLGDDGSPAWTVEPLPPASKPALPSKAPVVKINGTTLEGTSPSAFARRLEGEDGQTATIRLQKEDVQKKDRAIVTGVVQRSAEERRRVYRALNRTFMVGGQGVDLVIALSLLVAAAVLRRYKRDDPVATLFSFALLFGAVSLGTERVWNDFRLPGVQWGSTGAWIALFLIALPAFPSGRYAPAWTRRLFVAGPLVAVLLAYPTDSPWAGLAKAALFVTVALVLVLARVKNAGAGAELQQTKWAAVALIAGFLLFAIGTALPFLEHAGIVTARPVRMTLYYLSYFLTRMAQLVIPAGLLIAILGYRLNDADAAISRSTVFAIVTTVVGVTFTVTTSLMNEFAGRLAGQSELLATAISAGVALAVIGPARTRVASWAEQRFQGALVRLRSLPERLARWQQDDDPETVARRALGAIVQGVDATGAALITRDEAKPEIFAVGDVDSERLRSQIDTAPAEQALEGFPLRFQMNVRTKSPSTLLIGPRSDRATYSKEERSALAAVVEPLADTLRMVSLRAARKAATGARLDELQARLDRLAGKV